MTGITGNIFTCYATTQAQLFFDLCKSNIVIYFYLLTYFDGDFYCLKIYLYHSIFNHLGKFNCHCKCLDVLKR